MKQKYNHKSMMVFLIVSFCRVERSLVSTLNSKPIGGSHPRVILFAQSTLHPTPLRKYCSSDPSKTPNLYCDINNNLLQQNNKFYLGYFCMVTNLCSLKEVSISADYETESWRGVVWTVLFERSGWMKCSLGSGGKYIRAWSSGNTVRIKTKD